MAIELSNLEKLFDDLSRDRALLNDAAGREEFKRRWTGKEGQIKGLFKELRDLPADQKAAVAAKLNELRELAEGWLSAAEAAKAEEALAEALKSERIDLSLPSSSPGLGREHPVTSVERMITEILRPFGFQAVYGPEIETEYYCFDSLNIPKHHPARDMQDTFFTEELNGIKRILRTHTTSVQARTLQRGGAPVKVASLGRAYRNETEDASHQAMFHQYELVWVEEGLTVANLLALITHILRRIYGARQKIRFVPKFYPYTEPSIGPQLECGICKAAGCPACGGGGWVTVGGSGMIHRNVLKEFGYDPNKVSGFAFGLGTSRLAGQFYQLPKLREVYEGDLRRLRALV
jgi:phenylalanyl-tRNA synthetase alpha chain